MTNIVDMKQNIEEVIFNIVCDNPIRWKDVKHVKFEDNDVLNFMYVEAWDHGDSAGGDHYAAAVTRTREETDDEQNTRLEKEHKREEFNKSRRHESYLKLKKEFEP